MNAAALDTSIKLPDGFAATIFADKLDPPASHRGTRQRRRLRRAAQRRAQVAPSSAEGGVVGLRDTNGDGVADVTERFGRSDVDTGVAIHDGSLYFSSGTAVYAMKLGDQLKPSGDAARCRRLRRIGRTLGQADHVRRRRPPVPAGRSAVERVPGGGPHAGLTGPKPLSAARALRRDLALCRERANQDQIDDGILYSTGHRNVVALEWNPTRELAVHGDARP